MEAKKYFKYGLIALLAILFIYLVYVFFFKNKKPIENKPTKPTGTVTGATQSTNQPEPKPKKKIIVASAKDTTVYNDKFNPVYKKQPGEFIASFTEERGKFSGGINTGGQKVYAFTNNIKIKEV